LFIAIIALIAVFCSLALKADVLQRILAVAPLYGYHRNKKIHSEYQVGMPKTVSTKVADTRPAFPCRWLLAVFT